MPVPKSCWEQTYGRRCLGVTEARGTQIPCVPWVWGCSSCPRSVCGVAASPQICWKSLWEELLWLAGALCAQGAGHPGGVWGQRCLQPGVNGIKMMLGSGDVSPLSPSTARGLSPSSSSPSSCTSDLCPALCPPPRLVPLAVGSQPSARGCKSHIFFGNRIRAPSSALADGRT